MTGKPGTSPGGTVFRVVTGVGLLILGAVACWQVVRAAPMPGLLVGGAAALAWLMWIGHATDEDPPTQPWRKVIFVIFLAGSPLVPLLGHLVADPASITIHDGNWAWRFAVAASLGLLVPSFSTAVVAHHFLARRGKILPSDSAVLFCTTVGFGLLVSSASLPKALDLARGPERIEADVSAVSRSADVTDLRLLDRTLRVEGPTLGVKAGAWELDLLRHTRRLLRARATGGPEAPAPVLSCEGPEPADYAEIGADGTLRAAWAHGVMGALGALFLVVRWAMVARKADLPDEERPSWPFLAALFVGCSALLAMIGLHGALLLALAGEPVCARVVDARTWTTSSSHKGKTTTTTHRRIEAHASLPGGSQRVFLVDVGPETFRSSAIGSIRRLLYVPSMPSVVVPGSRPVNTGIVSVGIALVLQTIALLVALIAGWPSRRR